LLSELRLPGIKVIWPKLAAQSDKAGWPAARFLAALAEHEAADRVRRRIERHMAEARLPAGKTLATFDFDSVPMVARAQVMVLASGHVWLKTGANVLLFGPPGRGKSHLSAALGLALVENGWRAVSADLARRVLQIGQVLGSATPPWLAFIGVGRGLMLSGPNAAGWPGVHRRSYADIHRPSCST
jgi:DNA replication protein DnaC